MSKPILAIIDYGSGNVRSVYRAVMRQAPHLNVVLTDDPHVIKSAERVILPGQSAIRDCMYNLQSRNLVEPILDALNNKPFLAICIGPQVLLAHSEENQGINTLGYFSGSTQHFTRILSEEKIQTERIKIPHIGWNNVTQTDPHALWNGIPNHSYFYFVHSYFLAPDQSSIVAATTEHGVTFVSAIVKDNVFGAQFHPEKSDVAGLKLLENFALWRP